MSGNSGTDEFDYAFDSAFFKVLSEPARLEILRFVALNGECDISRIAGEFPQDRSVISRHLKQLADAGFLETERRSRHTYYRVNGGEFLNRLEDMTLRVKELIRECDELLE